MDTTKTPLWQQLAGAVGGGMLGLALYTGYGYVQPVVQAWLTVPDTNGGAAVRIAAENPSDSEVKRIGARAREIAEQFSETRSAFVVDEEDFQELDPPAVEPVMQEAAPEPVQVPAGEPTKPDWIDLPGSTEPAHAADIAPTEEHAGAPRLPSSGFGVLAALSIAAGATGSLFRRGVMKRLLSRA